MTKETNLEQAKPSNHEGGLQRELTDDDFFGRPRFGAHWQLFVPSLIIILAYGTGLGIMIMSGADKTALARLFLIVLAIGVPLLVVHAILRFYTIRVEIGDTHIRLHEGWPKRLPVDMPKQMIVDSFVKRGLSGRLMGGGTLIVKLLSGARMVIPDLADPEAASTEIKNAIADPDFDTMPTEG